MKLHKSVDADQGSSFDKILCRKYCMNGASLYCGCAWVKHVMKHYCYDSKRFFWKAKLPVIPQMPSPSELLSTNFAGEWLLSAVDDPVTHQILLMTEVLSTNVTPV